MKVVLINGSPHRKGNTFIALSEVAGALEKEGVQTEIIQLGIKAVQGCIACNKCAELGHCVFQDTLYNQVRGSRWYRRWFAGILCRSERGALCIARPGVLFLFGIVGLQSRSFGGCLSPGWGECHFRPVEQIFYYPEYAGSFFAILE